MHQSLSLVEPGFSEEATTVHPETKLTYSRLVVLIAWGITLFASILPEILLNETGLYVPPWLNWLRLGVLAVLWALAMIWQPLRPLRNFIVFWLVIFAASEITARISFTLPGFQSFLGGGNFVSILQPQQFGKLAVTLIVILALAVLGYHRKQFFLTPGELSAPITPVKWMGFPKPDPWWSFGGQYSVYIALGMGVIAWLVSRPSPALFTKIIPALPAILLFAAMNAFNEEMTLRAPMLATLEAPAGMHQAWYMSALYFGIAHFYGIPYGWIGIVLATFNGWLLGKAMLETRGLFWAWWMHFLQDVVIFAFLVMGSITPGG